MNNFCKAFTLLVSWSWPKVIKIIHIAQIIGCHGIYPHILFELYRIVLIIIFAHKYNTLGVHLVKFASECVAISNCFWSKSRKEISHNLYFDLKRFKWKNYSSNNIVPHIQVVAISVVLNCWLLFDYPVTFQLLVLFIRLHYQ